MNAEGGFVDVLRAALEREAAAIPTLVRPTNNERSYRCGVDGCERPGLAKGLCNAHYIRKRQGRSLAAPIERRRYGVQCIECEKPAGGKGAWGRCAQHFKRARLRALKTVLIDLLGGRCRRCGGTFPPVAFDFHHVDAKSGAMASLLANGSLERIVAEVRKCILLCANCHRIEHERL